ncbi:MAG: type II toxin-antitoxin system VapC family toxin [Thermodesulfobacteriota bacterium]
MKKIVIDASVALKWFFNDEENGERSLRILEQYMAEELELCAPSLLEYEIINGLVIGQRRGRIKMDTVLHAVEGFLNLEIPMLSVTPVYSRILYFCRTFNLTAYDAGYVAVAEQEGIPLLTADPQLYRNVKKDLKWVQWIGETAY